jgi:Rod binding domain-containing protein
MSSFSIAATDVAHPYAARNSSTQAPDPSSSPRARKLFEACQQFEGLLIADLWNEMEEGASMSGLDSDDPGAPTMQGLGIQSSAKAIAQAGGIGLARMLYQAVAPKMGVASGTDGEGSPG